jgi:hypothetical protein
MEAAFIVFLTVFLFQHADPRGDGMEMVGVGFAFMLIFLPFTMPSFILARHGRWLVLAAGLAALAAIAYFAFWLETVNELDYLRALMLKERPQAIRGGGAQTRDARFLKEARVAQRFGVISRSRLNRTLFSQLSHRRQ